jgi:hypothetical protein
MQPSSFPMEFDPLGRIQYEMMGLHVMEVGVGYERACECNDNGPCRGFMLCR